MPHIIARKLESRDQLERRSRAARARHGQRAGRRGRHHGRPSRRTTAACRCCKPACSSKYGFREVGVAGHPEGSKAIGRSASSRRCAAKRSSRQKRRLQDLLRDAVRRSIRSRSWMGSGDDGRRHHDADPRRHAGASFAAAAREVRDVVRRRRVDANAHETHERHGQLTRVTQAPDEMVTCTCAAPGRVIPIRVSRRSISLLSAVSSRPRVGRML